MPVWLIKYLIGLAFFPALLVGIAFLFLAATYMQVTAEREEEKRDTNHYRGRRVRRGRYQANR